jgi:hypothetical protein
MTIWFGSVEEARACFEIVIAVAVEADGDNYFTWSSDMKTVLETSKPKAGGNWRTRRSPGMR